MRFPDHISSHPALSHIMITPNPTQTQRTLTRLIHERPVLPDWITPGCLRPSMILRSSARGYYLLIEVNPRTCVLRPCTSSGAPTGQPDLVSATTRLKSPLWLIYRGDTRSVWQKLWDTLVSPLGGVLIMSAGMLITAGCLGWLVKLIGG